MENTRRGHRLEPLVLFAAFLLVNLVGAHFQKQISFNEGKGWEGVGYHQMAEQFARGEPIAAEAPLVYRVGTSFLAARVSPQDLFFGFKVVNVAANALSLILLVVWLRLHLRSWRVRALLGLLFLCQWDAPARWVWFYPAHTDPWMWVFLLGGLIAVERVRSSPGWPAVWTVGGVCAVGVLFREVVLAVPVALLFVGNPWRPAAGGSPRLAGAISWPAPRLYVPLVMSLATFLGLRVAVTQTDGYSFGWTALHWAYHKPFLTYLHGWLLAFGPVLFVLLFDGKRAWTFLRERQFLLCYLFAFAVLGYTGGTDNERLLFWSMPAVYVLLGRAMEARGPALHSPAALGLLVIGQVLSTRILWTTPDYPSEAPRTWPLLTPQGSQVPYLDLFSFHGARPVEVVSLLEFTLLGAVLWMLLPKAGAVPLNARALLR